MNENIDLTKILKDCPKGTKLYSTIYGDVTFCHIDENDKYPIRLNVEEECDSGATSDGRHYEYYDGECTLFPSKYQRDWSKFTAPLYKKEKFDPKTLNAFDRVLVRDYSSCYWNCDFFSRIDDSTSNHKYITISSAYIFCIPYNDDTKHLVGTTEEAPEYYKYWED